MPIHLRQRNTQNEKWPRPHPPEEKPHSFTCLSASPSTPSLCSRKAKLKPSHCCTMQVLHKNVVNQRDTHRISGQEVIWLRGLSRVSQAAQSELPQIILLLYRDWEALNQVPKNWMPFTMAPSRKDPALTSSESRPVTLASNSTRNVLSDVHSNNLLYILLIVLLGEGGSEKAEAISYSSYLTIWLLWKGFCPCWVFSGLNTLNKLCINSMLHYLRIQHGTTVPQKGANSEQLQSNEKKI